MILQVGLIICSVFQVIYHVFYMYRICLDSFEVLSNLQAINADLAEDLKRNGLTTLLDLVVKADLAETLADVEPATIFAPTNAAFESVPKDVLNSLLDDKRLLKDTLLNHIIPNSAIKFQDLKEDNKVSAAGGHLLRITVGRKSGFSSTAVNGVQVLRTDILAGSGSVIHTVNGVIPSVKESDNVGAIVSSDPQFSTLLAAIKKAGLTNALSTTGNPESEFHLLIHILMNMLCYRWYHSVCSNQRCLCQNSRRQTASYLG